jgi:tetratricopeptide (TPR) repeat protein
VSLTPQSPEVYAARAQFESDDYVGRVTVWSVAQRQVTFGAELPSQSVSDIDRAAQLNVTDIALLLEDADVNYKGSAFRDTGTLMLGGPDWKSLPNGARRAIQADIDRLTALTKDSDSTKASEACAALGQVQFRIVKDQATAEKTLLLALSTDPACGSAAVELAILLSDQGRYSDLASDLEADVAAKDNACARLLLARTYSRLYQPQNALDNARAALKLKPNSPYANLVTAEAEMAMGDASLLPAASANLAAVAKSLGPVNFGDLWLEYQ